MARQRVVDIDALLALNPEYVDALWNGEKWALDHRQRCESLNAGEPEGFRRPFDGKPRKWCGAACPFDEGCIQCTLPENPEMARLNRKHRELSKPIELARQGIITIKGLIDPKMVVRVRELLAEARAGESETLIVKIESPGGETPAGMQIFDMIRDAPVQKRIGVVESYALSMGTIILQACDWREAAPEASLLLHHARFEEITLETLRDQSQVSLMLALSEPDEERKYKILMERTKRTRAEIKALCDKDAKMTSEEALRFGLIDAIYTRPPDGT